MHERWNAAGSLAFLLRKSHVSIVYSRDLNSSVSVTDQCPSGCDIIQVNDC